MASMRKSNARRRNATSGVILLPAEGRQDPPPPVNPLWDESTREYWASIWASPMAVMWLDADVPTLRRLADLKELSSVFNDRKHLDEERQLEDRFGLNPKARRMMGWFIDGEVGAPKTSPGPPDSDASASPGDDASSGDRADGSPAADLRLRLVSGD